MINLITTMFFSLKKWQLCFSLFLLIKNNREKEQKEKISTSCEYEKGKLS